MQMKERAEEKRLAIGSGDESPEGGSITVLVIIAGGIDTDLILNTM